MLQNAYFLAKIGADTAENEQHFAENLPIGRRVAERQAFDRSGDGEMSIMEITPLLKELGKAPALQAAGGGLRILN